jgi:hypothetical protein
MDKKNWVVVEIIDGIISQCKGFPNKFNEALDLAVDLAIENGFEDGLSNKRRRETAETELEDNGYIILDEWSVQLTFAA